MSTREFVVVVDEVLPAPGLVSLRSYGSPCLHDRQTASRGHPEGPESCVGATDRCSSVTARLSRWSSSLCPKEKRREIFYVCSCSSNFFLVWKIGSRGSRLRSRRATSRACFDGPCAGALAQGWSLTAVTSSCRRWTRLFRRGSPQLASRRARGGGAAHARVIPVR